MYYPVYTNMKIRILRNVLVEVKKTKLDEVWDKNLLRWDELYIDNINVSGNFADMTTYEGDVILGIPVTAFEVVNK